MYNFVEEYESTNLPEINPPKQSTSQQEIPCEVCQLVAHGMHFGVMTCRPCAAFFRRIVVLGLKYNCVKEDEKCVVVGRGRNVCRDCRYKRCLRVGMTTDNVQYNRDVQKQKKVKQQQQKPSLKNEKIFKNPDSPQSDESSTSSTYASAVEQNDDEEMDAVLRDLKNLFVEFEPPKLVLQSARNQLERMCCALLVYRQNQRPAQHLNYVHKLNLLVDSQKYYTNRCQKFSKYIRCIDFFDSLLEEDKLSIVKISFTIFDRLERSHISGRIFGEESFTEQKYAFSSYCACALKNVEIETATAIKTEEADGYIRKSFIDNINMTCEEVIKPLYELQLSDMEISFMLAHVVMYNAEKSPPHLTKMFDELREEVAKNLHLYYAENGIENYTNRLLRMMTVVNNMKKIFYIRQRQIEMVKIFDVYKLSQKKSDLFCT